MSTVTLKIAKLRQEMAQMGLTATIIPSTDPHASEYMAEHWMENIWLTGFTGEAATTVVTMDEVRLWTDSRYYLQAEAELEGTGIQLMRASDIDCPTVLEWLRAHVRGLIGVNPEMWSVNAFAELRDRLAAVGSTIVSVDLIGRIWTDQRPDIPMEKVMPFSEDFAGESVESKLARIRQAMQAEGANAMVVSALDEIAWTLNIRGRDIDYNPMVISYLLIEQDRCTLFVDPRKVDSPARVYLDYNTVDTDRYEAIFEALHQLSGTILLDGRVLNQALLEALPQDIRIINQPSPIQKMKAVKNATELAGERLAMHQDGIALTRFFMWLEDTLAAAKEEKCAYPTEWQLMEKLHELRAERQDFVEESFQTIAGYRGNGAIVHYTASAEHAAVVRPEGMLLLDSGGQYLDGTTDITRTVWLGGDIPEQAKRDYTYVLRGHIAIQMARFPRGTRGNQLDILAKQYMWQAGITFGHGTGHGVGHFLGCHEGPQSIRFDNNPTPLEVGHVVSDEPGIYRTGMWGVRIENMIAVQPVETQAAATTADQWLGFETLTLCYYDTSLIDIDMLRDDELEWLNRYHQRVYDQLSPSLSEPERLWLANRCQPLKR